MVLTTKSINMKPNKENIVNEMLLELEKGISFNDCLVLFGTKWNLPKTTFARYWKTANERHSVKQESIQKELLIISTEQEKEKLKKAILTKEDALELLTKLAKSKDTRDNDKINAVKTMADMEGWKAPVKTDLTTGGNPLLNTPTTILFVDSDHDD